MCLCLELGRSVRRFILEKPFQPQPKTLCRSPKPSAAFAESLKGVARFTVSELMRRGW